MRGMKIGLTVAVLAVTILATARLSARADGFDANFYAKKYPDVVAVVGTDPDALYNHYVNFGAKEGRSQNQREDSEKYQALLEGRAVPAATEQAQAAPTPAAPAPAPVQETPAPASNPPANGLPYSTYVDIDIASQCMTYYENGQVKLQSPVVTGNPNRGNGTPTGTYTINSHIAGKRLIGPTWNVWVDTWMQFTPNPCHIGLHDANWRSAFGGDIYQSNGSHGCVNLPHDVAVALFNSVGVGTPVVVH